MYTLMSVKAADLKSRGRIQDVDLIMVVLSGGR